MSDPANQSHFVRNLGRSGVDLEALWQDTMTRKSPRDCRRAFDDRAETRFWARFSNCYDRIPSLYDYAPQVLDRILSHTGTGRTLIEIGCGTGKFTRPMLKSARHIHAVDFSPHMLARLSAKLTPAERRKITLVRSGWEAHHPPPVDCVFSVNAIYRMRQIRTALSRMDRAARQRVVIVWTMQRSVFDTFINRFRKTGLERNQKYIHLMAILYEMGIDPGLEFIEASKPVSMDRDQAFGELDALIRCHGLPRKAVLDEFEDAVHSRGQRVAFQCPLKVALIHWAPGLAF